MKLINFQSSNNKFPKNNNNNNNNITIVLFIFLTCRSHSTLNLILCFLPFCYRVVVYIMSECCMRKEGEIQWVDIRLVAFSLGETHIQWNHTYSTIQQEKSMSSKTFSREQSRWLLLLLPKHIHTYTWKRTLCVISLSPKSSRFSFFTLNIGVSNWTVRVCGGKRNRWKWWERHKKRKIMTRVR